LYLDPDREVSPGDELAFQEMVDRKLRREPLQYILGETEWYGLEIKCDPRALIPRPETEIIVEKGLELIKLTAHPRVADIGTGTGCIAIAIASHRPDATVVATDLSSGAMQLAEENLELHQLNSRVSLRFGDLYSPLYLEEPFDLIISNPPYVRDSELPTLMTEVRDHEPHSALAAGQDGLEVIRSLIEESPAMLSPRGYLVIEYGVNHDDAIRAIAGRVEPLEAIETIMDYNQRQRGIILRKR
jgi:release factor glutamine methyltransferase